MKGIILAGGRGSRLFPLTKVTNKHLLPVYNKPMIYHPIETLKKAGIKDILIVSGRHHAGHFLELLGRGEDQDLNFTYAIQEKEGGIAEALSLAESFAQGDNIAVILGDNIYEDNFENQIKSFEKGARIFIKEVTDPKRFGVAELHGEKVINIEEKPSFPKTNYAVTGFYIYDRNVFNIIKTLDYSNRGELEITDVNNSYIQLGQMDAKLVKGFWSDAGTFESLYYSSTFIKQKELNK